MATISAPPASAATPSFSPRGRVRTASSVATKIARATTVVGACMLKRERMM